MTSTITVDDRFRCRRGTAADLAAVNPVPLDSEIILESDTGLGKIGDGTTAYNSLLYTIVGRVDLTGLAAGKCLAWDATNHKWIVADRGVAYAAGTGIDIDSTDPEAPVISSTLGSIAVTNDVADYASLPTLTAGDVGQYWITRDTGMAYRWDGSAWPAEGSGVRTGSSLAWAEVASYNYATDGSFAGPLIGDVTGYSECRVQCMFLGLTASGYRYAQVSTDGGLTYRTSGYYAIQTDGTNNNYNNFGLHSTASASSRSGFTQFQLQPTSDGDIWANINTRLDLSCVLNGMTTITHVRAGWPGSTTGGRCVILAR